MQSKSPTCYAVALAPQIIILLTNMELMEGSEVEVYVIERSREVPVLLQLERGVEPGP